MTRRAYLLIGFLAMLLVLRTCFCAKFEKTDEGCKVEIGQTAFGKSAEAVSARN